MDALIVVDMQVGLLNGEPKHDLPGVIQRINRLAAKIREVGAAHHVPVLEAPPLARALYRHAEIGDEVPEQLYTAVAEVLAYVFQLRTSAASRKPTA